MKFNIIFIAIACCFTFLQSCKDERANYLGTWNYSEDFFLGFYYNDNTPADTFYYQDSGTLLVEEYRKKGLKIEDLNFYVKGKEIYTDEMDEFDNEDAVMFEGKKKATGTLEGNKIKILLESNGTWSVITRQTGTYKNTRRFYLFR